MKRRLLVATSLLLLIVVLAACGKAQPASTATHGQSVQITLTDFHIASSVATFVAGRQYDFVVTNHGQATHEFMIMPSDEGPMNGMPMADMDHMALASVGDFPPDSTRRLDFIFPTKMAGAHPQFACYDRGHYELGMHLDVSVTA